MFGVQEILGVLRMSRFPVMPYFLALFLGNGDPITKSTRVLLGDLGIRGHGYHVFRFTL